MHIDFLKRVFEENKGKDAIIWRDEVHTYGWLLERLSFWRGEVKQKGVSSGSIVALEGDFSPTSIALLLALIEESCIVVPLLTTLTQTQKSKIFEIAQIESTFRVGERDEVHAQRLTRAAKHPFFEILKEQRHPGLILFTSGTSGEPKAAVHDFLALLDKFKKRRRSLRILNFLLFDHWGGLNTVFHTLSNAGVVITLRDRSPDGICRTIEKHRIEVLPTSPTLLNLLLIHEAYKRHDLSSLKIISYGTEPMPLSTLKIIKSLFPRVKLQQTYGLIELGVMRSKSKSDDSLWVKVGGEGFQTRVVDGVLQIKAGSAMLGYLNAPSPFTEDGWFNTGDSVEVDGEYIKILGRQSEIINVGGEKVYPAEVENVIQGLDNVAEVTVYGEKNPITGNIVCANVTFRHHEDVKKFVLRLNQACRERLEEYKVPIKVNVVKEAPHSERFKKKRFA
jgi:acyl-coenzyme A synthetase/AMP-(fatty) acid ligase